MDREHGPGPSDINFGKKLIRRGVGAITERSIFRGESIDAIEGGLKRAEDLNEEGYGLIMLILHFSRRDPMQAMNEIIRSKMRDREISGPIAAHQTVHGIATWIARRMGINMDTVVTKQTNEKARINGKPERMVGYGSLKYMRNAKEALLNGGVMVVAPQATRETTLEYDGQKTVGGLLNFAVLRPGNEKVAMHFVSFGIDGTDDYGEKSGFNLRDKYQVTHGPTFTVEEALAEAAKLSQDENDEDAGINNIDRFVFDQLAQISPAAYLPKT